MVVTTEWLIDKSAYARLARSVDPQQWLQRIERGLIRIAVPTLLEVGYSARSVNDWAAMHSHPPLTLMPREHATQRAEDRAVEVQGALARSGHHRGPAVPDLLVAAIAETSRLTVLHVDRDFELIAEITGQPHEWLEVR